MRQENVINLVYFPIKWELNEGTVIYFDHFEGRWTLRYIKKGILAINFHWNYKYFKNPP